MNLPAALTLLLGLLLFSAAEATTPDELTPVGSGAVRYLGFIKVYDATLFAAPGASEAGILNAGEPVCLQLDYAVDVPVTAFVEAAETVLARQHDPATLDRLRPQIDLLHESYRDVRSGDQYRFCYDQRQQQSSLLLNDDLLVTIESADFAAVYFGIWLSPEKPIDATLRKNLFAGLAQRQTP